MVKNLPANRKICVSSLSQEDPLEKEIAGSHHGRSHPWRGHEEMAWHARPFRIQGTLQVGPGLYPTLYPPPFSAVVLVCPVADSFVACESSPAPLSLNEDQLKTLINKPPGRWYPMKAPGMKEMLQFKPFCWHSGLFDKYVLSLHKVLMIVLNILSTVR